MTLREVVRDLCGDREQRFLIQIRAAERQHQVGGTRTESGQHDAWLPAQFAMYRCRDSGVGLVPHQDEVHAGAAQFVHQHEHFASGQAEDALDAGGRKRPRDGRSDRHLISYAISTTRSSAPTCCSECELPGRVSTAVPGVMSTACSSTVMTPLPLST